MTGVELIKEERDRQMEKEGWTPEHDDHHYGGQMADAAACYAATEPIFVMEDVADGIKFRNPWPWHGTAIKKKDRKRDLVRAGALIAAELDRIIRLENNEASGV